jgi:L-lactate utilization protein LutB
MPATGGKPGSPPSDSSASSKRRRFSHHRTCNPQDARAGGTAFCQKARHLLYTDDPPTLTRTARKALRQKFLTADVGISGCNLACAETGHITTVSNEGNIRMATTLPRVNVAFMGMEQVTARLEDHDILFPLLSRGAADQHLAGYIS